MPCQQGKRMRRTSKVKLFETETARKAEENIRTSYSGTKSELEEKEKI